MSLFGGMLGDLEDDPIFGSHMQSMQHMNSMMNSLFSNPFGMMGPALMGPEPRGRHRHNQMMPFGFGMPAFNMNDMFSQFDNMGQDPNTHGMSSTSIMTYTSGPDGRPQVYQASRSTRAVPGGIKETQETVYDSRSGTKKMAIGHHIGERAHVIEKQKNLNNGDEEEHHEFVNLDEEEADKFNREWEQRARGSRGHRSDRALEHGSHHRKRSEPRRLALTDGTSSSHQSSRSRWAPSARRSIRPSFNIGSTSSTADGETRPKTPEASSSRKREHDVETETTHKRHMSNSHD
ncbi:myeloid leukemia factor isoform X3 [Diachasma alloeum]|uniref:myeloid leukemia factor isoform X3 n=1 Tax=Diachasma alloeum TaxID=454923 RepID=UPI0007381D8A|nr:myeloid leukemia factor isoform X3 [Diachasma alloeum]